MIIGRWRATVNPADKRLEGLGYTDESVALFAPGTGPAKRTTTTSGLDLIESFVRAGLVGEHSAGDVHERAGDGGGLVGGQEHGHGRDLRQPG